MPMHINTCIHIYIWLHTHMYICIHIFIFALCIVVCFCFIFPFRAWSWYIFVSRGFSANRSCVKSAVLPSLQKWPIIKIFCYRGICGRQDVRRHAFEGDGTQKMIFPQMKPNLVLVCVCLVGEYSSITVTEAQSSTQIGIKTWEGMAAGLARWDWPGHRGSQCQQRVLYHTRGL